MCEFLIQFCKPYSVRATVTIEAAIRGVQRRILNLVKHLR